MLNLVRTLILFFLLGWIASGFAVEIMPKTFDTSHANEQLELIHADFAKGNLSLANLRVKVKALETLQDKAETCVDQSRKQLKVIDERLKSGYASPQGPSEDNLFLEKKKALYTQQFSDCRLFVFRSQELLEGMRETILELTSYAIFDRSTPVWEVFIESHYPAAENLHPETLFQATGVKKIEQGNMLTLVVAFVLGLVIAYFVFRQSRLWLTENKTKRNAVSALMITMKGFILPVIILGFLNVALQLIFWGVSPNPNIELLSSAAFAYSLMLAGLYFLFGKPATHFVVWHLSNATRKAFYTRFIYLLSLIFIGYLCYVLIDTDDMPPQFLEFIRTIFVTLLSVLIIYLCWPLTKLHFTEDSPWYAKALRGVLGLALVLMLSLEWLGYHQLAIFFVQGVFFTAILLGLFGLASRILSLILLAIDRNKSYISHRIRHYLGVKPYHQINELVILRYTVYILLILITLLLLLKIWGVAAVNTDYLENAFMDGFLIGELKFIPSRLVAAIFIFCLVSLVGKIIAANVARHRQFGGEKDTQVAVASIINYVSFALALVVACLIAGVNFTGLAIIIGALSVGIGLGLQNIVNNFISGVILLLEKPIKPGDRVIVGNTEGFVKKVRIRSTQISTLAREDVIVPNSDLVTNQVTNYMFRDKKWRVSCQVGVAYGSNIDRVKEVLLDVGSNHPDVLQEDPDQPVVLFKEFGDSSLIFELWCIISDVNKKYHIISDLNFTIDNAFRQHNITIAFPQRDIHIHDHIKPNKDGE